MLYDTGYHINVICQPKTSWLGYFLVAFAIVNPQQSEKNRRNIVTKVDGRFTIGTRKRRGRDITPMDTTAEYEGAEGWANTGIGEVEGGTEDAGEPPVVGAIGVNPRRNVFDFRIAREKRMKKVSFIILNYYHNIIDIVLIIINNNSYNNIYYCNCYYYCYYWYLLKFQSN